MAPYKLLHLLRLGVTGRVGQADVADAGVQVRFDDGQHLLRVNRTFVAAAERRLNRNLDYFPGGHGLFRHRDDAPERLGGAHAGVLPAVGFAGRDAHAEHLHPAGHAALQSLLVQDQPGKGHAGRFVPGEVPEKGIRVGHLRDLFGVDERAELDDIDA